MANNDVPYFLEKLYKIDKELGGKAKEGNIFHQKTINFNEF